MSVRYARRYRDPVHGYVYVPQELVELIDSPFVARLRRIHQNGCGHVAYPSLTGNRFEHALGVMHLGIKAWDSAWRGAGYATQSALAQDVFKDLVADGTDPYFLEHKRNAREDPERAWADSFGDVMRVALGAAALLHDVGHGPYSHTLEHEFSQFRKRIFDEETLARIASIEEESPGLQFHEVCGQILSERALAPLKDQFCTWITMQILKADDSTPQWARAIHHIVSAPIDVDRLDYLLRDSSRAGTEFGAIDVERIIESMTIEERTDPKHEWIIGLGSRAVSAIETLLTIRERAYRWVYFHPNALAADTALRRLVHEAFTRDQDDLSRFDFLAKWGTDHTYDGSAWVDDAMVIDYLNSALLRTPSSDRKAERMRALHRVAVDGDRGVVFAWRSYEELLAAFKKMDLDWCQDLVKQAKRAEDTVAGGTAAARTWLVNEENLAAALNSVAKLRLEGDENLEHTVESLLNDRHGEVSSVRGTWIVTQRLRFSMRTAKIELWHNSVPISFERLSPIAKGLEQADDMRLKLWACFVPYERTTYGREERAHSGSEVADTFLSEFIGPTETASGKE